MSLWTTRVSKETEFEYGEFMPLQEMLNRITALVETLPVEYRSIARAKFTGGGYEYESDIELTVEYDRVLTPGEIEDQERHRIANEEQRRRVTEAQELHTLAILKAKYEGTV